MSKETEKKAAPTGFDLSTVDTSAKAAEGVEIELLHPLTGEPTGAFWTVVGSDSDKYAEAMDRATKRQAKKTKESGQNGILFSDGKWFNRSVVADCTTHFRGLDENGKETAFSRPAVKRILKNHKWIVEQAWRAINNRGLFLPGAEE